MEYLVAGMGGKAESVYGLAGSGDLYVTCQAGRNSRMGRLLGSGLRYAQARAERIPHDTVEGAELARAIGPLLETQLESGALDRAKLPLAAAVIDAVCHDALFDLSWDTLWK